jgi:membrane protein YdbS with pleckstrin-like domain
VAARRAPSVTVEGARGQVRVLAAPGASDADAPVGDGTVILEGRPDPRATWVWFLRAFGIVAFYAFIMAMPLLLNLLSAFWDATGPRPTARDLAHFEMVLWIGGGFLSAFGLCTAWLLVWSHLAVRRVSFRATASAVTIEKGVLFRARTVVPLHRIQGVQVKRGPVMALLGLGTVRLIHAASRKAQGRVGVFMGDGDLPCIRDAQRVADRLTKAIAQDLKEA